MKISEEDLKKIYAESGTKKARPSEPCPGAYRIMAAFTDEVSNEEKCRIVDHLSACSDCLAAFDAVRQFRSQGERLAERMSDRSVSAAELSELPARAPGTMASTRRWKVRRYLIGIAALLCVVVAGLWVLQTGYPHRETGVRGKAGDGILLLSPRGEIRATTVVFRWQEVPGAEGYRVELFDAELSEIWRSKPVQAGSLQLPETLSLSLETGRRYYWLLVVMDEEGVIEKSLPEGFVLKR